MTKRNNNVEQDRQYMYNITMRRVNEAIVAVEKQYVLHIGLCVHACACVCACVRAGTRARKLSLAHTCT
jgi:hypothetical protein